MSDKNYCAAKIQVLSGCEAIRKRPSMYVGDLDDPTLLSRLVIEGCCVAFADAKRGLVKSITITVIDDMIVSIQDDGPGWDTGVRKGGKPIPVSLMQDIYACRNDKEPEDEGFCKIGISVVNALSKYARIDIFKTKDHEFFGSMEEFCEYEFERGECITAAETSSYYSPDHTEAAPPDDKEVGTYLLFDFDDSILKTAVIDVDVLRQTAEDIASCYDINMVVKDMRL